MGRKSNQKKKKRESSYSRIESHSRQGKKLIPPFMQLENLKKVSWSNDTLPEYIWMALIVSLNERKDSIKLLERISGYFVSINEEKRPKSLSLTTLATIEESVLDSYIDFICNHLGLKETLQPLLLFNDLPGRGIWEKHLSSQLDQGTEWEKIFQTVAKCIDHQSQESTDCRWAILYYNIVCGKFILPNGMGEQILNYSRLEDISMIRPIIRSTEIAFRMASQFDGDKVIQDLRWAESFWKQGMKDTPCISIKLGFIHEENTELNIENYEEIMDALKTYFYHSMSTTEVDAKQDAVFGLAIYCMEILGELLHNNNNTSILSRIGLRTITECYLTLAYLTFKDDKELWQMYRYYGSGQAKLAYLKIDEMDIRPKYIDVETLKSLAGEDQWEEFVEINLGHWENTNLRKMSEIAKVKEEYNKYYDWTSGFAHGQWAAVRNTVFDTCDNPMHRLHRIPKDEKMKFNDVIEDAKRLCNKVLDMVDKLYPGFSLRIK